MFIRRNNVIADIIMSGSESTVNNHRILDVAVMEWVRQGRQGSTVTAGLDKLRL